MTQQKALLAENERAERETETCTTGAHVRPQRGDPGLKLNQGLSRGTRSVTSDTRNARRRNHPSLTGVFVASLADCAPRAGRPRTRFPTPENPSLNLTSSTSTKLVIVKNLTAGWLALEAKPNKKNKTKNEHQCRVDLHVTMTRPRIKHLYKIGPELKWAISRESDEPLRSALVVSAADGKFMCGHKRSKVLYRAMAAGLREEHNIEGFA